MFRIAALVLLAAIVSLSSAMADPDFQVGQKWSVKDSAMTLVIGRIEPFDDGGTAISISLFGVPCPPVAGCSTTTVAHLPFDSAALAASVDKLVSTNEPRALSFEAGYANWKQARGGIFTVPVSQIPALVFGAVGKRPIKGD